MADTPYLFISAVVIPSATALGIIIKSLWDYVKTRGEQKVKNKEVEIDAETELRNALLAERKMLLDQLIEERKFYLLEMTNLRNEVTGLRASITQLEKDNRDKDATIRDQQSKIDEQDRLIGNLRSELDELKSHDQTTH